MPQYLTVVRATTAAAVVRLGECNVLNVANAGTYVVIDMPIRPTRPVSAWAVVISVTNP
jgi:hypothetical protein